VVDLTDTSALPLTPVPAADAADRTDIADPAAAAGVPAERKPARRHRPRRESPPPRGPGPGPAGEPPVAVSKERGVLDHLPEREHGWVRGRLRRAWANPDADDACSEGKTGSASHVYVRSSGRGGGGQRARDRKRTQPRTRSIASRR
jgi:hypothetical protein